ncbi:MAG: hypothetical protein JWN04_3149 [Myxococcaceae bacterium]|nr:hypothetical protein [Myxococcaceae bacterium]
MRIPLTVACAASSLLVALIGLGAGAIYAAIFALAPTYLMWSLVMDVGTVARGTGRSLRLYIPALLICAIPGVGYWVWLLYFKG